MLMGNSLERLSNLHGLRPFEFVRCHWIGGTVVRISVFPRAPITTRP